MHKAHLLQSLAIAALLCLMPIAVPAASNSVWAVNVVGLKGEPLGTLTLELTDENTSTCMAGKWKKARIIESSFPSLAKMFEAKDYFATYEEDERGLSIQLNPPTLCDAYLYLGGKFAEHEGHGDYFTFGLGGGKNLGTFTARRP